MTKDCWIIFFLILSTLSLLAYLIIDVFVVPINVKCDYNDLIPDDAPIDLSMAEWQGYGMIFGLAFFGLVSGCAKNKTNSDCLIAVFVGIIILYVLFIFVWSIIGLVIYEHYYA